MYLERDAFETFESREDLGLRSMSIVHASRVPMLLEEHERCSEHPVGDRDQRFLW